MFVVRAATLLDLLAEKHPDLAAGLRAIAADPSLAGGALAGPDQDRDRPRGRRAGRRGRPGRDGARPLRLGGRRRLRGPGRDDARAAGPGVKVLGDEALVLARDASGLVVPAGGRTVAVVGLEDVVVVDTGDALLVTTYARAQDVKAVVDELKAQPAATDLT